jgi:hypothetical protein
MAHSRVPEIKSLLRLLSIFDKSSSWIFDSQAAREAGGQPPSRFFFNRYIVGSIKRNVKKMLAAF